MSERSFRRICILVYKITVMTECSLRRICTFANNTRMKITVTTECSLKRICIFANNTRMNDFTHDSAIPGGNCMDHYE